MPRLYVNIGKTSWLIIYALVSCQGGCSAIVWGQMVVHGIDGSLSEKLGAWVA